MALINDLYKDGDVVINITGHDFGGLLKMGDLIATLNVLEYMRRANNNPNIKFYVPDTALQNDKDYVRIFRDFIIENSDYISKDIGQYDFVGFVEIWSFRENHFDLIHIPSNYNLKKKICIFPLIDAHYNTERNFSNELLQDIINDYSSEKFNDYEKYICIKGGLPKNIIVKDFIISNDFKINLQHLADCEYFIGGDTGTSHLACAMNNPNKKYTFYYSYGYHGGWASSFTAPFHYSKDNVKMIYFNEKIRTHSNNNDLAILQNLIMHKPVNAKTRLGIERDGGYVIVDGYDYDFIISGGVGPDISFEFDFMKKYDINGVIFDSENYSHIAFPDKMIYFNKNIDSTNNLLEYVQKYKNIFLKLDIEGGEWNILNSPFVDYLNNIKQIVIEVHNIFTHPTALECLKNLSKTHHIVHVHENNNCHSFIPIGENNYPNTIELTYLRKDCHVIGLNDIHLPIQGIDFPNANYENHNLNFYPFNIKNN
jgi:hypothetical protein